MGESPLVSVVITTYNRAELLPESVESVLAQDYGNFEVIIVDDCSGDNTPEVIASIEQADDRVRSIRLPENRGAAVARNTGVHAARGDLIAFQDDDDIWLPGKLAAQVNALQDHPECALAYGTAIAGTVDAAPTDQVFGESDRASTGNIFADQIRYHVIKEPTVIIRKDVLEEVGYCDETLKTAKDTDLFLKITMRYPAAYVPQPVIIVREHPGRKTHGDRQDGTQLRCLVRIFKRVWDTMPASQEPARGLVATRLILNELKLARLENGGPLDEETIEAIIEKHPDCFDHPGPYWPLARAYAECRKNREARAAIRKAVKDPEMCLRRRLKAYLLYVWPAAIAQLRS